MDAVKTESSITPFGCCAFWQSCNSGAGTCVYVESNNTKMRACGAYKRHHVRKEAGNIVSNDVITTVQVVEEKTSASKQYNQLSLF